MPDQDRNKPDFSDVVSGSSSTAASGSPPDRDRGRADFSDVVSGSSSSAPSPGGNADATRRIYVVEKGDSLSKIAKKFYGDANQWRRIFDANRNVVKDPDLIQPGWSLTIPE
ncbi:MAG TPA: LysM peptidoglycan-binding domain-containing protein [Thermoanaerobaculia bacterium]